MTVDRMTAQVRELVQGWIDDARMVGVVGDIRDKLERRIAAWARRLVAESRAGALREALRRIAVEAGSELAGDSVSVAEEAFHMLDRIENWATDALAAEAKPGAQQ